MSKMLVKLGDVCIKDSSNIAQKDLINLEGLYPIYGASGFIKNINQFNQDKPYVAIVKDGAGVGRAMYLPAYSSVIGTLQYILPKDNIDSKYLFYAISFMDLTKYAKGATIPHIYFKEYKEELLNLPDLESQQKIVAKLDNLNFAIDKCKRLLELHDELIKSKFYEMFGDPLLNPMNWEVKKLQDISKIGSSKRIYQEELSTEAGIPFLRIFDILNKMNGLPIKINFYVPEENYNNLKLAGLVPKPNDVLVTSRGTLGKCYIVQKNDCFYFQDGMITWLSNFEKHMLPQYIYYLFQMPGFRTQIDTIEVGSTVAFLSISKIKNLKIILPPILLQTQFAQYVETVEASKTKIKELQSKIEYLKASYMQEYFA